jgi:hypothetical protein
MEKERIKQQEEKEGKNQGIFLKKTTKKKKKKTKTGNISL